VNIIERLYTCSDINSAIKKLVKPEDRDDFKQELFLILLESCQKKLNEINEKGQLTFYVVRIIINLTRQDKNVYLKKYGNHFTEYIDKGQADEDYTEDYESIRYVLENDNYHMNMLKIYAAEGSMRAVSDKTGIPLSSVYNAIKTARVEVKKYI
jgi:DNA-directed RNA polymerase specialized sigma24 family protein